MGFLEDLLRGAQETADRVFAKPQPQKKKPAPASRPAPVVASYADGGYDGPKQNKPSFKDVRSDFQQFDNYTYQDKIKLINEAKKQGIIDMPKATELINYSVDANTPQLKALNPFEQIVDSGLSTLEKSRNTVGAGLQGVKTMADYAQDKLEGDKNADRNALENYKKVQKQLNAKDHNGNAGSFITEKQAKNENKNMLENFVRPVLATAGEVTPWVAPYGQIAKFGGVVGGRVAANTGSKVLGRGAQYGTESLVNAPIFGGASTIRQYGQTGQIDPMVVAQEAAMGGLGAGLTHGAMDGVGAGVRVGAKTGQNMVDAAVKAQTSTNRRTRTGGFIAGPNAKGFKDAQAKGQVFDGVDGKRRFEVDDSKAQLTDIGKNGFQRARVGQVLDHPELFKNYPEIANTSVTFKHGLEGTHTAGQFDDRINEIALNPKLMGNVEKTKSTLLHEIQHRIQQEENFARGGTGKSSTDGLYKNQAGEAEARAVQARMDMGMGERYVKPKDTWYHGTNSKFDKFDQSKIGSTTDDGIFGRGFYFSNDKGFAANAPKGGSKHVMEVQPKLNNPLDLSKFKTKQELADYLDMSESALMQQDAGGMIRPTYSQIDQFTSHAKEMGHDGVLVPHSKYGGKGDELVVFDADKIQKAKPRSTFYDSLDVPKDELIVREGGGKAMSIDDAFIREEANVYNSIDDMVNELADDIYKTNRGGAGSIIGRTDDLGRGGMRISENPPFYQEYYKEFGKKPSKAHVQELVRDFLDGKNNAVRWELPDEVRDIATLVKKKTDGSVKLAPTPFDDLPTTAQMAETAKKSIKRKRSIPVTKTQEPAINAFKIKQNGNQKNVPVRIMSRDGDVVTSTNVNPNIKAKEKRYSVNDAGELIEDKKGATSLFLNKDGTVKGFRVGKEYFDANDLGDLSTVNGYGSTVATMRRNVERAFDEKTGTKVNEFLVDHQQAQATKLVNRQIEMKSGMQAIADDLGISFGIGRGKAKKVSAAIQDFGEKARTKPDIEAEFGTVMANKIEAADTWFRTQYDSLLDEMNTTLKNFGYDPVPKRNNYYTHFQDETLWKKFGLRMQEIRDLTSPTMQDAAPNAGRGTIDNKLAGLSETTVPNKAFNKFALQRKGDTHTADAFKAFELYLNPTLNNIYMTPSIARGRVISRAIAQDANIAGKDANATIVQLREWSNSLAGKSNRLGDRQLADTMNGQKFLRVLGFAQKAAGQNTIVGNLATAVLQPVVLTQTAGKFGYKNLMLGMMQEASGNSPAIARSGFLRRRYGDTMSLTATKMDRARNVANKPLEIVEKASTEITWHAAHNDALSRGMTGKKAIQWADAEAEKTIAGRSIGEKPELYRSKTAGPLTMFQLEVNNYWQQVGKEMTKSQVVKTMIAAYGFNLLLQQVTGRQVGFNPIDAAIDSYNEATKDRPLDEKIKRIGQRWAGEAIDNIPMVGQLGTTLIGEENMTKITGEDSNTGRFGVASPIRSIIDNPWMIASPFGGGQAKKTAEAIPVLMEGKLKNKEGETLVNVPQTPGNIGKGLLFGKSAIPEINQYYNNLGKNKVDQKAVQNQTGSQAGNQSLDGLNKNQQEMVNTAVGTQKESLRKQYIAENRVKLKEEELKKADKKAGKVTTTSTKKSDGTDIKVSDKISKEYKDTIVKYDKMDEAKRKEWYNKENDAEYKVAKAKYENDKASGTLDQVADYRRSTELKKLEIGSKYTKETRDLYKLGKTQLYNYVVNSPKGEKLAQELLAYDQALVAAGLNPYDNALKFKNGLAPAKGGAKKASSKKSSGSKKGTSTAKGTKSENLNSFALSTTKSVNSAVTKAKVSKKTLSKTGGVRGASIKAYKKPSKTKVSVKPRRT